MMNLRVWRAAAIAIVVGWFASPVAFAQTAPGAAPGFRRYNPATEVTVKGTVEEVKEITGPMAWPGTHLTVKTEKETLDVHLGPSDYLAQQKFEFAKGDEVEITGSKVKVQGADALLAREVKKGDKTLTLRDARGIPQWSRGLRRR